MDATPEISVVVPVFNEAGNIEPLFAEINDAMCRSGRSYEVIYVNDGSNDTTIDELLAVQTQHPNLRIIDLDGNFGEAAALCAGFDAARGSLVVTLDGDGQNDPADISRLLSHLAHGGYRVVSGWRQQRQEDMLTRILPSRCANALIRWLTRVPLHDNGCALKVYRREVLRDVALPRGFHRFLPAILGVTAAEVAEIAVNDRRRQHGRSHYGLGRTLVVMRDMLALPWLIRGRGRNHPLTLTMVIATTGFAFAMGAVFMAGGVGLIASLVAWNVHRFERAQRDGVYRVAAEASRAARAA